MERRTFLSVGSASVLALAAGYASIDATADGPAAAVREYYRRASETESNDEFAAEVPDLAHSASPLLDVAEDVPSVLAQARRQSLVDTEVVDEDVDADRIRETSDFFAGSLSDEELDTLAADNAVVAATLEDDSVTGGRVAVEWLVAPEDDEWRVVWVDGRNSPRAAVRRFVRQVKAAGSYEALDEPVAELSHYVSPLVNVVEYTPWYYKGIRRQELVETDVVAEDVDRGTIASDFTPLTGWLSEAELASVAEENAVVAVTLRDDELDVGEFEQEWLVATDADEWRTVWF